ncbi:anaphase-promoting complex subunit 5-like [Miscanthus floridulus]|uniref:anaphase-promoting complex subunit 5-like n=1 Tax=Miscanthus floridulus TaxID=154761 RepID=UPI003458FB14
MVRMNALVYATCFADAASSSELSLAYVELIQQLAVFRGYSAAFCALKLAEKKFPSSASLHIQLLGMQILHERALHQYKIVSTLHFVVAFCFHNLMCYYLRKINLLRGHLKAAQQICDEFGVLVIFCFWSRH